MVQMNEDTREADVRVMLGMFVVRKGGKFGQNWRFCAKKCKNRALIPKYDEPQVMNMQEQCNTSMYRP